MKWIVILLIVSLMSDIAGMTFYLWIKERFLIFAGLNFYVITSIICISLFYRALFPQKLKSWILGVMAVLLGTFFYFIIWRNDFGSTDRQVLSNIVFITYPIMSFYQLAIDSPMKRIQKIPVFWINSAFLIYFSATTILFIMSDYLFRVLKVDFNVPWIFHNVMAITKSILIAVGFSMAKPKDESLVLNKY